ncbi:DUF7507 domain-containing protein [Sphingobacterium paucimobilis]|uniref:DUF7507 domain-containing protein n=1 Tax=Sphingobacterium paucimobilis TaxID=1385985 RepID=UPI0011838BDE|nr:gliding motility-associated C-terminal domain-containing protein [Sphingobacterium paucimobilis]
MKQLLLTWLFLCLLLTVRTHAQNVPVCATPGADGAQSLTTSANTFYPSKTGESTLSAGSNTVELGAVPSAFNVGGATFTFGTTQITKGNLLLIIQMQGADMNSENTSVYGSGIAANNGSGTSGNVTAGQYEYVVALNDVTTAGGTLRFKGAGPTGGLINSYTNSNPTATRGVRRYQVVRLMQFSNVTLTNDIKTIPWNGNAGGLIAIDVAGTLDMNGKTIDASMTGFRGGYLYPRNISNTQYEGYRTTEAARASTKGEGIAGTPRFMWDGYNEVDNGATWVGYPNGDYGRGAPGNAGGGGNVHNAGGGGGGNGTAGGSGGYGWNSGSGNNQNTGGRPGAAIVSSFSRLYLGGGGGAGDANNATNGVKGGVGGGIVILTAGKIVGTGQIFANGGRGEAGGLGSAADGAGGGGAGGSIFINVNLPSPAANLTISAQGGNGGNSYTTTDHGPGGGGGGGVVYYRLVNGRVTANAAPGKNGRTNNGAGTAYGATAGSGSGVVRSFTLSELPPELQGISSTCLPLLKIDKSRLNTLVPIPAGSTTSYTITVTNTGGGAEGLKVHDHLPAGFTFVSATAVYSTEPTVTNALANTGTANKPQFGPINLPGNTSVTIQMLVAIASSTPPGTYSNSAFVTYLDPQRNASDPNRVITPAQNALPGANTTYQGENGATGETVLGANYNPAKTDEDVIVIAPQIVVTKSIDQPCVNGTTNIFTISVKNESTAALPIVIEDVMPNGLDVVSTSNTGWTLLVTGRTYRFTLNTLLAAGQTAPAINIGVRPAASATQSSWSNTAREINSGANATALLYATPTAATATASAPSACNNGTFYMAGNQPTIGTGQWSFVSAYGNAVIVNPAQYNTAITGVASGQTVTARWTITNGSCTRFADVTLTNNSVLPTAVLRTQNNAASTVCAGTTLPALEVVLTGTKPWTITYLDQTGLEVQVANIQTSPYVITNTKVGVYSIKTVKDASGCFGNASGSVILMESPATVGGALSANQTICAEQLPAAINLTGQVGSVLQWESSTDQNTWTILPGSQNMASYQLPVLTQTTYIRALVQSGTCGTRYSTVHRVQVTPLPTPADAGPDLVQYNSGTFTMRGNTPIVGTGMWAVVSGTATITNPTNPTTTITIPQNSSTTLQWTISNGSCNPAVDEMTVTYTKNGVLELVKAVSATSINAGEPLSYTVTVINRGPSVVPNVAITDVLQQELKNVTWTAVASGASTLTATSGSGNTLQTIANMQVGEENKVTLTIQGATLSNQLPVEIRNSAKATPADAGFAAVTSNEVSTQVLNKSGLSILKTGLVDADAGTDIAYTILVKNTGPSDARNLAVTDLLSTQLTNVSWEATTVGGEILTGATGTGNNLLLTANLPAGAANEIRVTIKAKVKPDFVGSIVNEAKVTPSEPGNPAVTSNTVSTLITKMVDIRINKSGPVNAVAGTPIRYVIDVKNMGPSDAMGIAIVDAIPAGITNVTWTAVPRGTTSLSALAGTGAINIQADMKVGDEAIITVEGRIDPAYQGTQINNTATVTVPTGTTVVTPPTSTVSTEISRVADLLMVKSGPAHAEAGKSIRYTLEIRNDGPSTAMGVRIQDPLPAGLLYASWTVIPMGGAVTAISGPQTGNVDFLADIPGETGRLLVEIDAEVDPALLNGVTLSNTATVSVPAGVMDPNLNNNQSTIVSSIDNDPVITVSKSGPATVDAGGNITYTIEVMNRGTGNIVAAEIKDDVPTDVIVNSWTVEPMGTASSNVTSGSGNAVAATVNIPAGAQNGIRITINGIVKTTAAATITNTATVTAGGNKTSSVTTSVNKSADLQVIKNGPHTINAGEDIHYTITVRNRGPVDVQGVKVVDVVPAILQNVSWRIRAEGTAQTKVLGATSGTGAQISVSADIAVGSEDVIVLDVFATVPDDVTLPLSISNTATLDMTGTEVTDYNLANNTSRVTTVVDKQVNLRIDKTGPATVIAGERITYRITVFNDGPSDAELVTLRDMVPANITAVSWTASGMGSATVLSGATGTGNEVLVGAKIQKGSPNGIELLVSGTVNTDFDGQLINKASVEYGNTPPIASPEIVTTVQRKPNLQIQKTGPDRVRAGQPITYEIKITNAGPSTAKNIQVSDVLDAKLINVSWTAVTSGAAQLLTGGTGQGNSLALTGDIPAGSPHSIVVTVQATVAAYVQSNLLNQAQVAEPGMDPVSSNMVTTFVHAPALTLVKTGTVAPDQNKVTYTFTVKNTGNVQLDNVLINDPKIANIVLSPASLAPGETATAVVDYTITQQEKNTGLIANTAVVTAKPPLGNDVTDISGTATDNDLPTEVSFARQPALSLLKTLVNEAPYNSVGQMLNYDIVVTNTGNVTLTDIRVTDLNAIFPNGDATIALLNPGEARTLRVQHAITQEDLNAGLISNQASGRAKDPDGTELPPVLSDNPLTVQPDDPTVTVLQQLPAITFLKEIVSTGPYEQVGDWIVYDLEVVNSGNVRLTDVVLSDENAIFPDNDTLIPVLEVGARKKVRVQHALTQVDLDTGRVANQALVKAKNPKGQELPLKPSDNPATLQPDDPTVTAVKQNPAWNLTKKVVSEGPYARLGDKILYDLDLRNVGNVTLNSVALKDVTAVFPNNDAVIGVLAPGELKTVRVEHTLTQEDLNLGKVSNQATVSGKTPQGQSLTPLLSDDPTTPIPNDPTDIGVDQNPQLSFTKSVVGTETYGKVGDVVRYSLTVKNTGNIKLTDVLLTDVNATFINNDAAIGTLDVGQSKVVQVQHLLTQAELDAGYVDNQARITAKTPQGTPIAPLLSDNPDTPEPGDVTRVLLQANPKMMVLKWITSEGPYDAVGKWIAYAIQVRNTGNMTLTNIVLTDANAVFPDNDAVIGTLAPGESKTIRAQHELTQADLNNDRVDNRALASGNKPDGNPITVQSEDPTTQEQDDPTSTGLTQIPQLIVKKVVTEAKTQVGEKMKYTVMVENTGNVTLRIVTVLDPNAVFPNNDALLGTLDPGDKRAVVVEQLITQADVDAGMLSNQAFVTAKLPNDEPMPPIASDNPNTVDVPNDPTVSELLHKPSLRILKKSTTTSPFTTVGQLVTYDVEVMNDGNVTLSDIVLTDDNGVFPNNDATIAQLSPGATVIRKVQHVVTQEDLDAGKVTNQVFGTAITPSGNLLNRIPSDDSITTQLHDPTVVTGVMNPAFTLQKRTVSTGPYEFVGDVISYEITVRNVGNVTLKNIVLTDANGVFPNHDATIATLPTGASYTALVEHVVTQEDLDAGRVSNQVTGTAKGPDDKPLPVVPSDDPNTPVPNDPTLVEMTATPSLVIQKAVVSTNRLAAVGDIIRYEILVFNAGNVTLKDIVVTDANATFPNNDGTVGTLLPGASKVIVANHILTQAELDAGVVLNQAIAKGKKPDGTNIPDQVSDNPLTVVEDDETVMVLDSKPMISVVKTYNKKPGALYVGDKLEFSIRVKNVGNVTLHDVQLRDENADVKNVATIPSLSVGEERTFVVQHTVTTADMQKGYVANIANAIGKDPQYREVSTSSKSGNPVQPEDPIDPMCPDCTIAVLPWLAIEAVDDSYGPINGANGGTTASVLANDKLNDVILNASDIVLTPGELRNAAGDIVTGMIMNANGTITVSAGMQAGVYSYEYRINERLNPLNSATAKAIIVVAGPGIKANNDNYIADGRVGSVLLGNILSGTGMDTYNGTAATLTEVSIQIDEVATPMLGAINNNVPVLDAVTGNVSVRPLTPAGTYTIRYTIVDRLNPTTNTSTALVTVSIPYPAILAQADNFGPISGITGGTTASVLQNDKLNGVDLNPADVKLNIGSVRYENGGIVTGIVMQLDGTIVVDAAVPSGIYKYDYTICEVLNPANCSTGIATVNVAAPIIKATNDAYVADGYVGNTTLGNVLTGSGEDSFNGAPATLNEVRLKVDMVAQPVTGAVNNNVPVLDVATGNVSVPPMTPAGEYTIMYTIVDRLNPGNSSTAYVYVSVPTPHIQAIADTYGPINGVNGATTGSVLANDLLNGAIVENTAIRLTPGTVNNAAGNTVSGIVMNADGTITVASGTPAGIYTYSYTINELLNPSNTAVGTATVEVIAPTILATDDNYTVVNGRTGSVELGNVLSGQGDDWYNGSIATGNEVRVRVDAEALPVNPGLNRNVPLLGAATGNVSVPPMTPAGTYTITYTIIDKVNPTNTSTAKVTIVVEPAKIQAVNDSFGPINGVDGGKTTSVLANDLLNGKTPLLAEVNLTPGSVKDAGGNTVTGIGMNTDGTITVAAGTTAGTYTYTYEICELLNPTNCTTGMATIVLAAPGIQANNDNYIADGRAGAPDVGNVLTGSGVDTYNGKQATVAEVTIRVDAAATPIAGAVNNNVPVLDAATGKVSVPAMTPAGTYTITYTIIDRINAGNTSTANVIVQVAGMSITAVADSFGPINGVNGGKTTSVLANDLLNGVVLAPADVRLTPGSVKDAGGNVVSGILMNPDGTITVASGMASGTYTYTYEICELLNPTTCATGTATIVVTAPGIKANDDKYTADGRVGATSVGNVLTGTGADTYNGTQATLTAVTIRVDAVATPITGAVNNNVPVLDAATGNVSIPAMTPAGTYTITYTIIDKLNPENTSSAKVMVVVEPSKIQAISDSFGPINGVDGGKTTSVLANDLLNGAVLAPADVQLTPGSVKDAGGNVVSGILMNPDGTITVASGMASGTYTYTYEICALLNPTTCATGTATIVLAAPVIKANDDKYTVDGREGSPDVGNVLTGAGADIYNGMPATLAAVTIRVDAAANPITGAVNNNVPVLDAATGNVSVPPMTPAGTYKITYTIIDKLNPANTSTGTVTIVVPLTAINAEADNVETMYSYKDRVTTVSVLENDRLADNPIDVTQIVLKPGMADGLGIYMNVDGTVTIDIGTKPGVYHLPYQICEVLNPTNCSEALVTITVKAKNLMIPNVITPNGDEKNESFVIVGAEAYDEVKLTIVNRWGNEVFRDDNYRNTWTGAGLNEGTYYYILRLKHGINEELHKGHILIKRE